MRDARPVREHASGLKDMFGMVLLEPAASLRHKFNRMKWEELAVNDIIRRAVFNPSTNDNQFCLWGRIKVEIKTARL